MRTLEYKTFSLLIILVSLAFAWILWPFHGAVFWGAVTAIVFAPLNRRLSTSMPERPNLAALAAVLIILVIVILPLLIITASLVQEASSFYTKVQSGELNFLQSFQPVFDALPKWATDLLELFGLPNLGAVREKIATGFTNGVQFLITQALTIGQSTFDFFVSLGVMLYLLFFLLRDGEALSERLKDVIPLRPALRVALLNQLTLVIRATITGDIFVAVLQGALGGLIFWLLGIHASLLWAFLMAVLSLLPVIGAALVWLPVAIYLLATGALWQGVLLILYGLLVIGLVDNFLRPILVGKATKMPDYVVLISTLGGIETFGLYGFIIGPVIAAMFLAVWDIFSTSQGLDVDQL